MIQFDETYEIVKARQDNLRALASPQPLIPFKHDDAGAVRQRLGHALVRFGRWVEGHCPEPFAEVATT
jgi:hypothetical protein